MFVRLSKIMYTFLLWFFITEFPCQKNIVQTIPFNMRVKLTWFFCCFCWSSQSISISIFPLCCYFMCECRKDGKLHSEVFQIVSSAFLLSYILCVRLQIEINENLSLKTGSTTLHEFVLFCFFILIKWIVYFADKIVKR